MTFLWVNAEKRRRRRKHQVIKFYSHRFSFFPPSNFSRSGYCWNKHFKWNIRSLIFTIFMHCEDIATSKCWTANINLKITIKRSGNYAVCSSFGENKNNFTQTHSYFIFSIQNVQFLFCFWFLVFVWVKKWYEKRSHFFSN